MERGQSNMLLPQLPEHLVEKIVATIPFPYVFKAQLLSNSWLAKFSPISHHDNADDKDKEKGIIVTSFQNLVEKTVAIMPFPRVFKARVLPKSGAKFSHISHDEDGDDKDKENKILETSFQKQVLGEFTITWKTYQLVVSNEDLFGYDRASNRWQRMPSLSFLYDNYLTKARWKGEYQSLTVEGALLLVSDGFPQDLFVPKGWPQDLFVANILTGTWKILPPCPYIWTDYDPSYDGLHNFQYLVSNASSETYKVIKFYGEDIRYNQVRGAFVYNSKLCTWSKYEIKVSNSFTILSNRVSFNGINYWLVGPILQPNLGNP